VLTSSSRNCPTSSTPNSRRAPPRLMRLPSAQSGGCSRRNLRAATGRIDLTTGALHVAVRGTRKQITALSHENSADWFPGVGRQTKLGIVAIRASREVLIDAPPNAIIDEIADVQSFPLWSPVHSNVEVIDTYPDGRPHHVTVTVKLLGITDEELLEYHWAPDSVVWDAEETPTQHGQHVEFTMLPEIGKTRVRIDITLEPGALVPDFLLRRPRESVLARVAEGLRQRVMARAGTDSSPGNSSD
jgi:Polyketide cyclase / dehydrase and lipid transport